MSGPNHFLLTTPLFFQFLFSAFPLAPFLLSVLPPGSLPDFGQKPARLMLSLCWKKGSWSGGSDSDIFLPVFRGSWKHPGHFQRSSKRDWKRQKCSVTHVLAACHFCWLFWKSLVINFFRISFPFYTKNIPITLKHIFPFFKKKSEDREGNSILLYVHDTEDTKTPAWDEFTNQMQTWSAL